MHILNFMQHCKFFGAIILGDMGNKPGFSSELLPSYPSAIGEAIPVMPEEIGHCLGNLAETLKAPRRVTLLFMHLPAIAAPLILYRLKRQGFSNCRAKVDEKGLLVEVSR